MWCCSCFWSLSKRLWPPFFSHRVAALYLVFLIFIAMTTGIRSASKMTSRRLPYVFFFPYYSLLYQSGGVVQLYKYVTRCSSGLEWVKWDGNLGIGYRWTLAVGRQGIRGTCGCQKRGVPSVKCCCREQGETERKRVEGVVQGCSFPCFWGGSQRGRRGQL